MTSLEEKRSLRSKMRKLRRDLDSGLRAQRTVQLAEVAGTALGLAASQRVACYLPYQRTTRLVDNHFGIPEPEANTDQRCPPSRLHTVLMPLVAFDSHGNRLGMGGGYYDQTFAFKKRPRVSTKPRLIGVAHEFQRVAELPNNDWDVPLDGILTERVLRMFSD
jgi:5-formyltetrahydrofolate cyclo-ligase